MKTSTDKADFFQAQISIFYSFSKHLWYTDYVQDPSPSSQWVKVLEELVTGDLRLPTQLYDYWFGTPFGFPALSWHEVSNVCSPAKKKSRVLVTAVYSEAQNLVAGEF